MAESFRPRALFESLVGHGVDFVVVGGVAGVVHGSSYPTYDVDIVYARDRENLERLAEALRALEARLRGAPPDVPFILEAESLRQGAHFTFTTPYGPLDILSDPDGAPAYRELKRAAGSPVGVEGVDVYVASLDHLIAMKDASGRPKDKLMATEYRVLSDVRGAAGEQQDRET